MLDPMKLFNQLKEKAQAQSQSGNGGFGNPNILKLQKGKNYSLRLLWLPSEERENPMINQYIHHHWDDNAVGSKDVSVICPTSQYDLGDTRQGFASCPICSKMSQLYKDSQNGSESAGELYGKFKRTLRGYVPVYVVAGPEEDKHKIKIFQYTISFKRFFDEKIFGVKNTSKNNLETNEESEFDENNIIGLDAFMYYDPKSDSVITSGHNLLISVGTKKIPVGSKMVEMPDYKPEFSMKNTEISSFGDQEITVEYFKEISKMIGFDSDFYKMSNQNDLVNFMNKYVNENDAMIEAPVEKPITKSKPITEEETEEEEIEEHSVKPISKAEIKTKPAPVVEEISDDEDEDEFKVFEKKETKPAPKAKAASKAKPASVVEEEAPADDSSDDDDDFDIDDIMKDIDI